MNEQMKSETPYLTYGNGFEEDERINAMGYIHDDIVELAKQLVNKYPGERLWGMHKMFQIAFRCGVRSERENDSLFDELHEFTQKAREHSDQDWLLDASSESTRIAQSLKLIESFLEQLDYRQIKGDEYPIYHSINKGMLALLMDNIETIREKIELVSDGICPGE